MAEDAAIPGLGRLRLGENLTQKKMPYQTADFKGIYIRFQRDFLPTSKGYPSDFKAISIKFQRDFSPSSKGFL